MTINSVVPGHRGRCRPTWWNRNQVCNKFDGGVTGFFRLVHRRWGFLVKYGPEFHGIARDGEVHSTATN